MASRILCPHRRREQEQRRRDRVAGEAQHVDREVVERKPGHCLATVVDDGLGEERDAPAEGVGPSQEAREGAGVFDGLRGRGGNVHSGRGGKV